MLRKVMLRRVMDLCHVAITERNTDGDVQARDWIDNQGGPTAVARTLEKKVGTVCVWAHRNVLPRSVWPEILQSFPKTTMDDLLKTETVENQDA